MFVFALLQLLVLVEQVVELAAVDFVHTDRYGEIAAVVLPVIDATFEQIFNSNILQTVHGEGFARASLSIGEYTYIVPLHRGLDQILYLAENVALLRVGLEDLVKAEGLPLVRQIALSLQFIGSNPLKGRGLVSLLVC